MATKCNLQRGVEIFNIPCIGTLVDFVSFCKFSLIVKDDGSIRYRSITAHAFVTVPILRGEASAKCYCSGMRQLNGFFLFFSSFSLSVFVAQWR